MDLITVLAFGVAVVGAFILRVVFLRWQGQRAAKRIIMQFGDAGAITPARACRPDSLGIPLRSPFIGLRDHRPAALNGLIQAGALLGTEDGRYYLSAEAYRFYNIHRGR